MIDLKTLLRRIGIGIAVFLAFFLILSAGFRIQAAKAHAAAVDAEKAGDWSLALGFYDRAIRAYYPFSGIAGDSRDRMMGIARNLEKDGKPNEARRAYQTLLSALCAVETGLSGNRALIGELEKKVKSLLPPDAKTTGALTNK